MCDVKTVITRDLPPQCQYLCVVLMLHVCPVDDPRPIEWKAAAGSVEGALVSAAVHTRTRDDRRTRSPRLDGKSRTLRSDDLFDINSTSHILL